MAEIQKEWLTIGEAMAEFGHGDDWWRGKLVSGEIKGKKNGKWLAWRPSIEAYFAGNPQPDASTLGLTPEKSVTELEPEPIKPDTELLEAKRRAEIAEAVAREYAASKAMKPKDYEQVCEDAVKDREAARQELADAEERAGQIIASAEQTVKQRMAVASEKIGKLRQEAERQQELANGLIVQAKTWIKTQQRLNQECLKLKDWHDKHHEKYVGILMLLRELLKKAGEVNEYHKSMGIDLYGFSGLVKKYQEYVSGIFVKIIPAEEIADHDAEMMQLAAELGLDSDWGDLPRPHPNKMSKKIGFGEDKPEESGSQN